MSRRTYGVLQISQRHPKLFARMHGIAERARVIRGEPYTWPMVPWRSDKPARRRDEPRSSRFGELA